MLLNCWAISEELSAQYTYYMLHGLKKDIKRINEEPKLIVKADKTTNFYKMTSNEYNELAEEKKV